MTESTSKRLVRRGRIFPEITISPEELAKPKAERDEITEILLGSEWLKILPLVVNYQAGILTLG